MACSATFVFLSPFFCVSKKERERERGYPREKDNFYLFRKEGPDGEYL